MAFAATGGYLLGVRRALRTRPMKDRRRFRRAALFSAPVIPLVIIGSPYAPIREGFVIAILVGALFVIMAIRWPRITPAARPRVILLCAAMGLLALGLLIPGDVGLVIASAGFLALLVGGHLLAGRGRRRSG